MGLFFKTPEQKYELGMKAYKAKKYTDALYYLEPAAEAGHLEVQYQCGYYYYCAAAKDKIDYPKAFSYFLKAARQGHTTSQVHCGDMYLLGKGMEQDLKQALFWYEKAAEQGESGAQRGLVRLYYEAKDTDLRDLAKAAFWAEKCLDPQKPAALYDSFDRLCSKILHEFTRGSEDPDKLCSAGVMLFNEKKYSDAEELFKKSLEKKELSLALYYYGKILIEGLGGNQDQEKGWELMEKAAEQGHILAQHETGFSYYQGIQGSHGHPTPEDYEKALQWYLRAAEQGSELAMDLCGDMYRFGIGTASDPEKARYWYEKANEQGSKRANAVLYPPVNSAEHFYERGSEIYYEGRDYDSALKFLEWAGDLGHRGAQYLCGQINHRGWSWYTKTADWARARYWYEKAAGQGHPEAQFYLGTFYSQGKGVQKDLKTALCWYEKAAAQEQCEAQRHASEHYLEGLGTEQNPLMALYWMERAQENGLDSPDYLEKVQKAVAALLSEERETELAAMLLTVREDSEAEDYAKAVPMLRWLDNQGSESAKYLITSVRLKGLLLCSSGTEAYESKDYVRALNDFEKAAFIGHAEAQYNCGILYYHGRGTEGDSERAFYWYNRAAKQGHAGAQNNLGYLYDFGQGTPKNLSESLRWYEKAAEQGLAMAQYNCGLMYLEGKGTDQDKEKARALLEKAAEQGHEKAGKVLAEQF